MRTGDSRFVAGGNRPSPRDPWNRGLWNHDLWDVATVALLAALAVLAFTTFGDYAISNDEEVQRHYGELILQFYHSGLRDQALFHYKNLYLYGGLFDVVSGLVERTLPGVEPYDIRHVLCALTGIGGIAATAAIARLIAGPRAGFIAAAVLALCGPWYGGMFNHTKDIPFAAAMAGGLFFLLRTARQFPRPTIGNTVLFGLLLGAALGIRVLALLLVGYAGLAVATRMLQKQSSSWRDRLDFFSRSAIALIPAFVIGYAIMIFAWPWAALAPLNPIRGLVDFGNFHYDIRTILDGQIYQMAAVPRWYVPAYLLIKVPLVMLAGAGVALSMLAARWRDVAHGNRAYETALLAFAAVFPVLCEVIDRGPAFTGLRHFLFVVPMLAALAGIGLDASLSRLRIWRPQAAAIGFAALAAVLVWNTTMLVRLHPYQYLFYNPLVGGLQGATGRYATDYWVNIMPEAVERLEDYVAQLDRAGGHPQRYLVAVCGERVPFEVEANSRLQWTEDWERAEFFIAPTHMNCDRVLAGRVISGIDRVGARIGVVKDRRAILRNDIARHP
jgi:hypothetical protein